MKFDALAYALVMPFVVVAVTYTICTIANKLLKLLLTKLGIKLDAVTAVTIYLLVIGYVLGVRLFYEMYIISTR